MKRIIKFQIRVRWDIILTCHVFSAIDTITKNKKIVALRTYLYLRFNVNVN